MAFKLKVCGITRSQDWLACAESGIDAIGLNLWSESRRGISVDHAEALCRFADRSLSGFRPKRVGVFVDHDPEVVSAAAKRLQLDLVQYHGNRPLSDYGSLEVPYIWVLRGTTDLRQLKLPERRPEWVLLDSMVAGYGGQGTLANWNWCRQAVEYFSQLDSPIPVWLAGGITATNLKEAMLQVGAAGLDLASGVESPSSSRGEKDSAKIAEISRLRERY